jgi:hypothetical protein
MFSVVTVHFNNALTVENKIEINSSGGEQTNTESHYSCVSDLHFFNGNPDPYTNLGRNCWLFPEFQIHAIGMYTPGDAGEKNEG